jgi:ABC-2 type transport system permease protein
MTAFLIAREEWRYWARSRLALTASALLALVLLSTAVTTATHMAAEQDARLRLQEEAHQAFISQPARHPHRMVHYGHYVFRPPAPLAAFDPGLDPITGHSIFLEGHRQNTATFAVDGARARLGTLRSLSPAVIYQLFAPLLLVILGFGAVARERESATLVTTLMQQATATSLLVGKFLALAATALAFCVPALGIGLWAAAQGETPVAAMAIALTCFIYLLGWCAMIVCVSAWCRSRHAALSILTALWIGLGWVIPSVAVDVAARSAPVAGKIDADLRLLSTLRAIGDGHNAGDPAFARLRADLLAQHGTSRPEDLPVNLRGVVAQYAEAKLTRVLNEYASRQMSDELQQARTLRQSGWSSPAVAFASASRALAGTSLEDHHRFLREAETLRFAFVQALNRVHAEQLAYSDDIARSSDAGAERRTRVDPATWQVLDEFRFHPTDILTRLRDAAPSLVMLSWWLLIPMALCLWAARRLESTP